MHAEVLSSATGVPDMVQQIGQLCSVQILRHGLTKVSKPRVLDKCTPVAYAGYCCKTALAGPRRPNRPCSARIGSCCVGSAQDFGWHAGSSKAQALGPIYPVQAVGSKPIPSMGFAHQRASGQCGASGPASPQRASDCLSLPLMDVALTEDAGLWTTLCLENI